MGIGVATTTVPEAPAPAAGPGALDVARHEARHDALRACAERGSAITAEMAGACIWTDAMLAASHVEVRDVPFITIGGGMGSFAMADMLRIAGVPASDIEVIGPFEAPYGCLKLLLDNSQIPATERIRSGSSDRMDNLWGWPGYSLEEAFAERRPAGIWHSVTEPILAEYMTPRASLVYRSIDREAQRISWSSISTIGRVPLVRKRREGGYFVVIAPPGDESLDHVEIRRARFVHLAVGFSAAHLLPDLAVYGGQPDEPKRAVNVYEPHEHVYLALTERPGSVLVRGAASSSLQVVQRIAADRAERGARTEVYHLFRSYVTTPDGPPWFRIPAGDGFAYQAFTFAKGAYGGQLQRKYRSLRSDEERAALIAALGSTAVPPRSLWKRQFARGRREGWYHTVRGSAGGLETTPDGRIRATINHEHGPPTTLDVDYVIDATGAEANVGDHEILADLVDCSGAKLNFLGQLAVNDVFEVQGMRSEGFAAQGSVAGGHGDGGGNGHGDGGGDANQPGEGPARMYATGIAVQGNPSAVPMYSFWALQYTSWKTSEDLARCGFSMHMGSWRSAAGWWRRMRNRPPRLSR